MLFCLRSPPLHPTTGKALALPICNPIDKHGRVFFLAWTSFMFSFLAWYAMPPLLNRTIQIDLDLTRTEILISNIIALVAGLLTRLVAGPLCDKFGPRYVLVGILWSAAIPTGLAGTVAGPAGLYVIRFFIGLAGAAFVPANLWVVSFYDQKVVGTATAFAAGWGDAGVGITFFVMPSVFDSLMSRHNLAATVAWRVSFIVPCLCLLTFGALVLTLSDDTPTGSWSTRPRPVVMAASRPASLYPSSLVDVRPSRKSSSASTIFAYIAPTAKLGSKPDNFTEGPTSRAASVAPTLVETAPSFGDNLRDAMCPQTLLLAGLYFCGLISDLLANRVDDDRRMHVKKYWACSLCVMQGAFCLWVGLLDSSSATTLLGGVAGIAIFMQAANGAICGIVFCTISRFSSHNETVWIVGAVSLAAGALLVLIPPVPVQQREQEEKETPSSPDNP
ncbi:hypothetical protein RQP46_010302 [Phenoliferia psychrophenolica]